MRFVSVASVALLGASIGSAAVLVPLSTHDYRSSPGMVGAIVDLVSGRSDTPEREGRSPVGVAMVDTGTIEHLTAAASTASKPSPKVKVTETPWAAQVSVPADKSGRITSSRARSDEQRVKLARELQAELRRVGCYEGNIDGDWGLSSKDAMAMFNDRVNASLPFDEPDYILLTLVQGHQGRACGLACPGGQGFDANGRCVPASVLAHGRARSESSAAVAAVAAGAPAAAMPVPVPQPAVRSPARTGGGETGSTVATRTQTARTVEKKTVAAVEPAAAETANSARVAPLPGRMSIGGPIAPALTGEGNIGGSRLASPTGIVPKIDGPVAPKLVKAPSTTADDTEPSQPVTVPVQSDGSLKPAAKPRVAPSDVGSEAQRAGGRKPQVTVHRPPPQVVYAAPRPDKNTRQRRMIYELFQNPNRN